MSINNWQVIDEATIYENNWIKLQHFNVLNPNGGKGIYGKVSFKNLAIGIVPIDENGYTWLVGQQRFPLNKYSWEIPEGGCPLNEEPLQAAQRELLEETGLVATHWQLILESDLSNSVTDEKAFIFLATQLKQHNAEPDETEQLEIRKVLLTDAFKMIENKEITDAVTILALQKIQLMLIKKELNLESLIHQ